MTITTKDGRTFTGTASQILHQMKSLAMSAPDSIGEYIDWVVESTQTSESVSLHVVGETVEARAQSLIDEMLRVGLASTS